MVGGHYVPDTSSKSCYASLILPSQDHHEIKTIWFSHLKLKKQSPLRRANQVVYGEIITSSWVY